MTPEEYAERSKKTAIFQKRIPDGADNIIVPTLYCTLALCGESGEVAEQVKKCLRDDDGIFSEERLAKLKKELGDVLWYWTQLSSMFGFTYSDIAKANIEKLEARMEKGVLGGSGSDR